MTRGERMQRDDDERIAELEERYEAEIADNDRIIAAINEYLKERREER